MEEITNPINEQASLIKTINKLIIFLISIVLVNITLAVVEPTGTATDLRGQLVSPMAVKMSVLMLLVLGFTIIGFMLGSILSAFPYKKLPYPKKYLPASLTCIFGLHIIYFILEIKYWIQLL